MEFTNIEKLLNNLKTEITALQNENIRLHEKIYDLNKSLIKNTKFTNREYLNSLSNKEFAEYIESIFKAGLFFGKNSNTAIFEFNDFDDYEIWLEKTI